MTEVATKQDQVQVRVPIMIEITEEDRQSADHYSNICGCLVWTALRRMGYSRVSVGAPTVRLGGDDYSSDEITSSELAVDHFAKARPFYRKEVVGKQIVLYPK